MVDGVVLGCMVGGSAVAGVAVERGLVVDIVVGTADLEVELEVDHKD